MSPLSSERGVKCAHLDFIPYCSHVDAGTLRRLRALLALFPSVAHTDGQLRAVAVERHRGHGGVVLRVLAQPLLQLVIPYRDGAVRAGGSEGIVPVTKLSVRFGVT